MNTYFLVAHGQPDDTAIYYTSKSEFHGGELWGNVNEAYRFESKVALLAYLSELNEFDLGRVIIVSVFDVTWEKLITGYNDIWWNGKYDSEEANLYRKFNTVSYITNSEQY